ncbi:MAG: LamG domain-containing protein, partial [Armatimonadetes bacterium]|nr:LamG domain-containing protein [Armatimonadota bacterium]
PDGRYRFSVDILNSPEAPADWYMEFRDWRGLLQVGPTFAGTRDGRITAGGKFGSGGTEVALVPNGTWVTIGVQFATGPRAPKIYALTVKPDGEPERVFADLPFPDVAFEQLTWFGISSLSIDRTLLYVDNLLLGPADTLTVADAMAMPAVQGLPDRPSPAIAMRNTENLALYWKFDETRGFDLTDSSGNGLDGDLGGVARATGAFGRALYLDAGGASAEVADNPLLQFGAGDFTVECWLCPTQLAVDSAHQRRRLLDKGLYPDTWWNVDIWSDGRVQMEIVDSNQQNGTTVSAGTLKEAAWTHLAIVVDRANSSTTYYLNGLPDCSRPLPAAFTGNLNMAGKSFTTGGWQPFIGLLDELKVYKRALTTAEVAATCEASRARYTSAEFTTDE